MKMMNHSRVQNNPAKKRLEVINELLTPKESLAGIIIDVASCTHKIAPVRILNFSYRYTKWTNENFTPSISILK